MPEFSTRHWARPLCLLALGATLLSCTDEDVEWIEVPLEDNVFFPDTVEHRQDTIEIPLFAGQDLEYKLTMAAGNAVSYDWHAVNLEDPERLLVEFHGHTIRETEAPGDVMFYKRGRFDASSGYMVAPFSGIHGWYFANESNQDVNIILELSGFYTLE